MPALILRPRSSNSFNAGTLMTLINCIPGGQKPSIQQLMSVYPNPIHLELTNGAFETTAIRIFLQLNTSFDIQFA